MARVRTLDPPLHGDAWSFRGLGRWRSVNTVPQRRTGILEADRWPAVDAPVEPGEPRG